MDRRKLLFFTLFVVTVWFYAGVTDETTELTTEARQQSVQMFNEVEAKVTDGNSAKIRKDQG